MYFYNGYYCSRNVNDYTKFINHRSVKAFHKDDNVENSRVPLQGYKHDELGSHRRMRTEFTLSNNGKIEAKTRIWTNDHWKGFHGNVVIFLTDAEGNWLWKIGPEEDWVDGQYVGHNDKTFTWSSEIPVNDVKLIKGYAIWHSTVSKPQFLSTLKETGKVIDKVKEIYNKF